MIGLTQSGFESMSFHTGNQPASALTDSAILTGHIVTTSTTLVQGMIGLFWKRWFALVVARVGAVLLLLLFCCSRLVYFKQGKFQLGTIGLPHSTVP